jgi:Zn-dependent protease
MTENIDITLALIWFFVFVVSVSAHEGAHAFAAMKLGDLTAYHGGQVTINPLPHMKREPFGMIIVPIISFLIGGYMVGWASTPYDPSWADRHPRREAVMGLAGPSANLILILISAILIHVGIFTGVFVQPESISFDSVVLSSNSTSIFYGLAILLSILFTLNVILLVFNLIPLAPLDGISLLHFLLPEDLYTRYRKAMQNPGMRIFGLIIAWNLFDFIFSPIHGLSLSLLYPGSWYS